MKLHRKTMLTIVVLVCSLCTLATDALQPAGCEKRFEDFGGIASTFDCPANCDIGSVYVVGGPYYFIPDSLVCAAAIHAAVAPVTGGKVVFRKQTSIPPPLMKATTANGVTTIVPASASTTTTEFFAFDSSIPSDCAVAAEDIDQEVFVFNCPSGCETNTDIITDVVFDDATSIFAVQSLICVAAIYDGTLTVGSGGAVVVQKQQGILSYGDATSANGVDPGPLNTYDHAFIFSFTIDANCLQTVSNQPSLFVFTCPANCDPSLVDIMGDGIYNEGTPICLAAIHDGQIIAADGGDVIVNKRPGQSGFSGSTRNGVISIWGGPDDGFDFSDCINGSPTSGQVACTCDATWFGDACNIKCVEGSYDASNNPACTCNSGWVGPMCNYQYVKFC
uniref:uncharacterized protein LOC120329429 n=1 Tax=Styela clava TaxID=7725 RepID=UPI0019398D46|nr:uncharacterized protein LOC120329429 [Styela clava]XP_039251984.1 uncharacterized protein LOC120329429 [Styela clava]